ncbi:MAG: Ldh family oxidoreductase, partial [Alphaproteobacteria bacterium]|nr:Ldh family oxidoreductase [Alphaproteobacteria bacterium]
NPNNPTAKKIVNGMCSIYIDPNTVAGEGFAGEVSGLTEWVKSSPKAKEGGEILMPGDPELRTKAERMAGGIPLDDNTWAQLAETAAKVGINNDEIARLAGRDT